MDDTKKFLDAEGVKYLWSKVSMQDYPNNETLMAVIKAIDAIKADKESPEFTGVPTAPTANPNTNTKQIATTEFVNNTISELTTRLNALADSDDTTLDQLSEIVTYIKNNKSLIDGITTSKVNVADIINNLTTNVTNKPLSAAQGVALKTLIDAITVPTKVSELTNDSGYLTSFTETDPTVPAWAKAANKPSYTASEVGLGNVDNVKQYSASNPPPYPVTSVNGQTGDVTVESGAKPNTVKVTLTASGWDSTANTQTVTATGVLADETAQLIQPTPALASQAAYYKAGILCTSQAADSLTFTATTIPMKNLTVYVVIQDVIPPPVTMISFTIDGTSYQAEEGMTWGEWANSNYNTLSLYSNGDVWGPSGLWPDKIICITPYSDINSSYTGYAISTEDIKGNPGSPSGEQFCEYSDKVINNENYYIVEFDDG